MLSKTRTHPKQFKDHAQLGAVPARLLPFAHYGPACSVCALFDLSLNMHHVHALRLCGFRQSCHSPSCVVFARHCSSSCPPIVALILCEDDLARWREKGMGISLGDLQADCFSNLQFADDVLLF